MWDSGKMLTARYRGSVQVLIDRPYLDSSTFGVCTERRGEQQHSPDAVSFNKWHRSSRKWVFLFLTLRGWKSYFTQC